MPRKKKRYENEEQILEDINSTHQWIKILAIEAELLDRFADVLREYVWEGTEDVPSLVAHRELADRKRGRLSRYKTKKLPRLSDALAQMRTGIFPEIVDDKSIEAT